MQLGILNENSLRRESLNSSQNLKRSANSMNDSDEEGFSRNNSNNDDDTMKKKRMDIFKQRQQQKQQNTKDNK